MPDLVQLQEEHLNLLAIAGRLTGMIAQAAPPPSQQLYSLRMELSSALIRHLKTEDWILYPALLTSGDERIALTSRAFSAEMGGLAKAFEAYAKRWSASAIGSDWTGYQRETGEILRLLKLRVAREERDLYPLLQGAAGAADTPQSLSRSEATVDWPSYASRQDSPKFFKTRDK